MSSVVKLSELVGHSPFMLQKELKITQSKTFLEEQLWLTLLHVAISLKKTV